MIIYPILIIFLAAIWAVLNFQIPLIAENVNN